MKKRFFISIFLVLLTGSFAWAYKIHPDAGKTSASFLKIPIGSRASSFAAYTSIVGDIYGVFYNPASTAIIADKIFSMMQGIYYLDIWQYVVSYGFEPNLSFVKNKNYISFHLSYIDYGRFERRSGLYEDDPTQPSQVEGRFDADDLMIVGNYSFVLNDSILAGFNLKFINERIDNYNASTIGVDLGIVKSIRLKEKDVKFGLSACNLFGRVKFVSSSYQLPVAFRFGVSSYLSDTLVGFDILKYIDNYPYLIVGFERKLSWISLRASYRYRVYGNENGYEGVSLGVGVQYRNFDFGYSISNHHDLGFSHKMDMKIRY